MEINLYCSTMQYGDLYKEDCNHYIHPFICNVVKTSKINDDKSSLMKKYSRGQVVNVPFIRIGYRHQGVNQTQLDQLEWMEDQISGFKVEWYLEDENGTRVRTSEVQKPNNEWKEVVNSPKQQNEVFQKTVKHDHG